MLTRRFSLRGTSLLLALAAASVASAATPSVQPSQTPRANRGAELARMTQAQRSPEDKKSSAARFLEAPACALSENASADHFAFVHNKSYFRGGLVGGSYGEIFFGGGASARAMVAAEPAAAATPASSAGDATVNAAPASGASGGAASSASSHATTLPAQASEVASAASGKPLAVADLAGGATAASSGGAGGASTTANGPNLPQPGGGQAAVNPEPATLILLGTGLGGVLLAGRRRARRGKD